MNPSEILSEHAPASWWVYMLRCSDQSLYTGITTDICRRLNEHNSKSISAAKYTRSRQPVSLIYLERAQCRSSATKREVWIKRLPVEQKRQLLKDPKNLCDRAHHDSA